MKKLILFLLIGTAFQLIAKEVTFKEKTPYDYPVFVEQTDEEKNGIKLKIVLPDLFERTVDMKNSMKFNRLKNGKTEGVKMRPSNFEKNYVWKKSESPETKENYRLTSDNHEMMFSGWAEFDKDNKIVKVGLSDDSYVGAYYVLEENCYHYIPDKELKVGDEWEYSFAHSDPDAEMILPGIYLNVYVGYALVVKSKLLGYAVVNNKRVAVIESDISSLREEVIKNSSGTNSENGGGTITTNQSKVIFYLDYKNNKIISAKRYSDLYVQGSLYERFGETVGEALENIKDSYIYNPYATQVNQYFFEYKYK